MQFLPKNRDFNPRHPYGWRLAGVSHDTIAKVISIHATHTGGDLSGIKELLEQFISIHATHTGGDGILLDTLSPFFISIHATHTGGDDVITMFSQILSDFNPRHPYGWRRDRHGCRCILTGISIHATHTGGDMIPDEPSRHEEISIHATHTGGDINRHRTDTIHLISIHATHTGGDRRTIIKPFTNSHFNPRHPYGWRLRTVHSLILL